MFPTAARLSKASRAPLTPKRGNKDYYKGTRQAFLPGGPRTGAPGKHIIRGRAKYRLLDSKVRVYVAPPIEEIESSLLKPYVVMDARLNNDQKLAVWGKYHGTGGLTPEHFLRVAREHTYARLNPENPTMYPGYNPSWMNARIKLHIMGDPSAKGIAVRGAQPIGGAADKSSGLRELEVVEPKSS